MRSLLLLVAIFFSGFNPVVASLPVVEKTAGNDAITQSGTAFFCASDNYRFAFGKEENTVTTTGSNLKNDTKKHFTFSSSELTEQEFSCFFRTSSLKLLSGFRFPYYILFRRLLL